MATFKCSNCKEEKRLNSDNFHKKESNKTGYQTQCKECLNKKRRQRYVAEKEEVREYNKRYYKENVPAIKKQQLKYRKKNRERLNELGKQYYHNNKEYYAELNKKYYAENKEYHDNYMIQYSLNNKERISEYNKHHYQNNKELYRKNWQTRRARMAGLPCNLTEEEWQDLLDMFGNSCAYCGVHQEELDETLQRDHVIPVVKGGGYTKGNIVPACRRCNNSKGTKDLEDWLGKQEFYTKAEYN